MALYKINRPSSIVGLSSRTGPTRASRRTGGSSTSPTHGCSAAPPPPTHPPTALARASSPPRACEPVRPSYTAGRPKLSLRGDAQAFHHLTLISSVVFLWRPFYPTRTAPHAPNTPASRATAPPTPLG